MEMSEFAREKLAAVHKPSLPTQPGPPAVAQDDSSHPTFSARIGQIKSLAISLTPGDQRPKVAAFIEEYDLIAKSLCTFVKDAFAVVGP